MRLAQAPPGAQAPGSGYKGGFSPLGAWFTRLCALSPTLERRAEAARGVTVVYESFAVWFSTTESTVYATFPVSVTIDHLFVFAAGANGAGNTTTYTIRVNGTDTGV